MKEQIEKAQQYLKEHDIDGWLLYNFQKTNHLALDFLQIPEDAHLTRRFFYWIPKEGEPVQIVHKIEPKVLSHLPGKAQYYTQHKELRSVLEEILEHKKCVAMEYSEENHLPYISKLDAGTKELIEMIGPVVTSSGPFLQYFTCQMSNKQIESHRKAAKYIDRLADLAFDKIRDDFKNGLKVNEFEIQQWIVSQIKKNGFFCDYPPGVAFAENTADPHYSPSKDKSRDLKEGDLILLDIIAKSLEPNSVYADITRMAVASTKPSEKQQMMYQIVREAQEETFKFIKRRFELNQIVKGFEADEICRDYISERELGEFFIHRTGHNLFQTVHGPGAHLDSIETQDDRPLIPNTAFTIEPGLYFPNEFGVRVEYDVLVNPDQTLEITSGVQDSIRSLL